MVLLKDSVVNDLLKVLFVAFGEVEHSLCISEGGVAQAFAIRIFANTFEDRPDTTNGISEGLKGPGDAQLTLPTGCPVDPEPPPEKPLISPLFPNLTELSVNSSTRTPMVKTNSAS